MNFLIEIGLSNALVATVLAVVAWVVARLCRRPEVAFVVWLLVLAKLVMPPLVNVPWEAWRTTEWMQAYVGGAKPVAEPAVLVEAPTLAAAPDSATVAHRGGLDRQGSAVSASARLAKDPHAPISKQGTAAQPSKMRGRAPQSRPATATPRQTVDHFAWIARAGDFRASYDALIRWLGPIWLAGSALWFAVAAARIARFVRLLRRTQPAPAALVAEVGGLAQRMGLRRVPTVRLVAGPVPPLVWSLAPTATLLLPAGLPAELSSAGRATLIAHELAHVERRSCVIRWLELVALGLYWWHPVAWFARHKLEQAEELCCDARVVGLFPQAVRTYADTLLATVDFLADERPAIPLGARGFSEARHITRRLEMILSGNVSRRVGWPLRLALVGCAVLVLPLSIERASAEPAATRTAVIAGALTGSDVQTLEKRLDRLEKLVQTLTDEVRGMRKTQSDQAPPKVVKSEPAAGAKDVDPSLTEIKVTFNKDMQDGSWSWTQGSDDTFPEVVGDIHYEKDMRTCASPVKLEPGKTYKIGINSARFRNFKDKEGNPAVPYPLTFKTKK